MPDHAKDGPPAQKRTEFKFLTIERPEDAMNAKFRRQIRSHVTSLQHRQKPLNTATTHATAAPRPKRKREKEVEGDMRKEGSAGDGYNVGRDGSKGTEARRGKAGSVMIRGSVGKDQSKGLDEASAKRTTLDSGSALSSVDKESGDRSGQRSESQETVVLVSETPASHFGRGAWAFQAFALDDLTNTIGTILKRLRTDLSCVLSYYEAIVDAQAPDFERQYLQGARSGFGHDLLIPMLFTEPALLATAILVSTGHLVASRGEMIQPGDLSHVQRLQCYVYHSINTAIGVPQRSTSDQLIIAVMLLAAYEALHGQRDLYHVHMKGMVQMINIRGGLPGLGMNGYLEAFVLWQDGNLANIYGGEGYSHLVRNPSSRPRAKAEKSMFLLGLDENKSKLIR